MATTRTTGTNQLKAENQRLRAENERLRQLAQDPQASGASPPSHWLRQLGVVVCAILAVVVLVAGNVLFWTGNTIVKNDRFTEAVSPVIRDKEVQQALAGYTTTQLYKNVDVTKTVQDALPPQAEFLAPTIASQLQDFTKDALGKVLANDKFQSTWNDVLSKAQVKFIDTVRQSGGNGVIDLNDLYQQISDSLKGTKLSFLADKQLPDQIGSIQVASGSGIQILHTVIVNIDMWEWLALLLFVVFAGLAIFLARRRRRMVVRLCLYFAAGMLVTLLALGVVREVVAGKVDGAYAEAVRHAVQIVLHALVVQTATLLAAFVLVAVVAWLTGPGRGARYVQGRVQLLFAGKLHHALFGEHENAFTRWVGRYKHLLEWIVVGVVAVLMLITRLTPRALVLYALLVAVVVLGIELLAAPERQRQRV